MRKKWSTARATSGRSDDTDTAGAADALHRGAPCPHRHRDDARSRQDTVSTSRRTTMGTARAVKPMVLAGTRFPNLLVNGSSGHRRRHGYESRRNTCAG